MRKHGHITLACPYQAEAVFLQSIEIATINTDLK